MVTMPAPTATTATIPAIDSSNMAIDSNRTPNRIEASHTSRKTGDKRKTAKAINNTATTGQRLSICVTPGNPSDASSTTKKGNILIIPRNKTFSGSVETNATDPLIRY